MEPKKNPSADLEVYRGIFLQAGMVLALIICIVAINWKSYDASLTDLGEIEVEIDDEIIPITQQQTAPPPPPPPPPPHAAATRMALIVRILKTAVYMAVISLMLEASLRD